MTREIGILIPIAGFVAFFALGLLISSIILRAAVSLSNKLAGIEHSENPIPEPSIGKGMGIVLVAAFANAVSGFSIGFLIASSTLVWNLSRNQTILVAQLIALPVGFLVMSGMLAALLPTSFKRGMLVSFCQLLIGFAIAASILAGFFLVKFYMA